MSQTQTLEQVMQMIVEKYGSAGIEVCFETDMSGYIYDANKDENVFFWDSFSDLIISLLP